MGRKTPTLLAPSTLSIPFFTLPGDFCTNIQKRGVKRPLKKSKGSSKDKDGMRDPAGSCDKLGLELGGARKVGWEGRGDRRGSLAS